MNEQELTSGAKLRMAREQAGLTLREMAERVNYDHGNLHRAEGNKINLTPDIISAYEQVVGHPLDIIPTAKSRKNPQHEHVYHVSAGLVTVRYCETCERSWILANDSGWRWIPIPEAE